MLKKLLLSQLLTGFALALLLTLLVNADAALSLALGVAVSMALNTYVFSSVFLSKARAALDFVKRFYRAHFLKMLLLAVVVTAIAINMTLVWWAFLLGLLVAQLSIMSLLVPRWCL